MLEQPRTATRSKSKEKRVSAPPSLLTTQMKAFSPKSSKQTAADDLLGFFSNGTEQETSNNSSSKEAGKTGVPATVNPRNSVNTQIVQGLFDMVGPNSSSSNNNSGKGSQKEDDLDDLFGFGPSKGTSKGASKESSDRNTAPPKTIQGQAALGLKVIQEGKEVPPVSSSKKKAKNGEEDKEEEEEEEEEEGEEGEEGDDDKDSDSENDNDKDKDKDKAKNAAKQLSEAMNKPRARSASNQVTSSSSSSSSAAVLSSSSSSSIAAAKSSSASASASSASAFGKDSGPKAQTDALVELHRGTPLLKYPHRRGFPHFKYTQLSKDNTTVQWFSRKKKIDSTCIRISDIKDVLKGQETQVFRKFQQTALEKASFSIVFGRDYQSLDLVAKSTDECDLWVLALKELVSLYKKGTDLTKLRDLVVPVNFKDRNRPQSRLGSGRFIRANESTERKVDSQELREVKKEMADLKKSFDRVKQLSQNPTIIKSSEIDSIRLVVSELEERFEELTQEINDTRDTEMSKRDVWRASVDLQAIEEKIEVVTENAQKGKRLSNFW